MLLPAEGQDEADDSRMLLLQERFGHLLLLHAKEVQAARGSASPLPAPDAELVEGGSNGATSLPDAELDLEGNILVANLPVSGV